MSLKFGYPPKHNHQDESATFKYYIRKYIAKTFEKCKPWTYPISRPHFDQGQQSAMVSVSKTLIFFVEVPTQFSYFTKYPFHKSKTPYKSQQSNTQFRLMYWHTKKSRFQQSLVYRSIDGEITSLQMGQTALLLLVS